MRFYENGRISLNHSPILKIQNLAYSGLQDRSFGHQLRHARRHAREMTSRARDDVMVETITNFEVWSPGKLLCAYLINGVVNFADFLHANQYDWPYIT